MKTKFTLRSLIAVIPVTFSIGCSKFAFTYTPTDDLDAISTTPPAPVFTKTEVVAYANKQVDFLLVLDDSNSMLPELQKLAARMEGFIQLLDRENIDWQMCLTTTRGMTYGVPRIWSNYTPTEPASTPTFVLKKGTPQLSTIFNTTINNLQIGGAYSGDERGIKATLDSLNNASKCYRSGAAISVILISDEDVRSVGGDSSKVKANDATESLQPLEDSDKPEYLLEKMQSAFGQDLRFTFNSIIVKPNDRLCETEQDKSTSPSHPGYHYEKLSRLTNGGIGSICDADYSYNLNIFKDKIINSLNTSELQCAPDKRTLIVEVNSQKTGEFEINGKIIKFKSPLPEGTTLKITYSCFE